jgi:hypothetical protein
MPLPGVHVLQQRQPEGGRLARPGLRLAQQVASLKQDRNGPCLNRRRAFPASLVDRRRIGSASPNSSKVATISLSGASSSMGDAAAPKAGAVASTGPRPLDRRTKGPDFFPAGFTPWGSLRILGIGGVFVVCDSELAARVCAAFAFYPRRLLCSQGSRNTCSRRRTGWPP